MNKITCENCRFFEPFGMVGTCRANPPSYNFENNAGVWPLVLKSDWCGRAESETEKRMDLEEALSSIEKAVYAAADQIEQAVVRS